MGRKIISQSNALQQPTAEIIQPERRFPITERLSSEDESNLPWTEVVRRKSKRLANTDSSQNIPNTKRRNWRSNLQVLHGTARDDSNDGQSFSADIDLVAYGVGKNITALQLSKFLQEKGLSVKDCSLLTKFEGARSLSYKVTIKSTDLDIAKNPGIWPYRVGVRLYKHFNATQRNNNINRFNKDNNGDNDNSRFLNDKGHRNPQHRKFFLKRSSKNVHFSDRIGRDDSDWDSDSYV